MKNKFYTFITLILLISFLTPAKAQTATTIPDTIINKETFGAGSSRVALPNGRTTYTYKSSGSLDEGEYMLYRKTSGRPEWFDANDYTPNDNNGRAMVVNGSLTQQEFYRDTVYGLTMGSIYSLSLQIMNVNTYGTCGSSASLPQVKFLIETYNPATASYTTISTFTSSFIGQTVNPTWVKVYGSFYVPPGFTSVRYRILNNSTGGCGNDLAIDDITFYKSAYNTLPVTGLQASASNAGNTTAIRWETTSETNSKYFIVEKSTDGTEWTAIDSVKAAGFSNAQRFYNSNDNKPAAQNFYRIREVDADGRNTYSNTIKINLAKANLVAKVYPNPVISQLQADLKSDINQQAAITISDASGRQVARRQWQLVKGNNSIVIPGLQQLTPGIYFVSIVSADGTGLFKSSIVKN